MRLAVRLVALMVGAAAVAWACGGKSPSQPTPVPSACSFAVSPASLSVGGAGGSAAVTVSTTALCAWTAASDRGWMTIDSGASGTGSGTVKVSLTANSSSGARAGTLTVAGQAVAVTQDGTEPCAFALSPATAAFGKDAATGSFSVTSGAACTWTAAADAAWVTITSAASGTGSGTVAYAVARNTDVTPRTASIRVAEQAFSISQQGDAGLCQFSVAPVTLSACMAVPYELVTSVTTQTACTWTAATDTPWITLSGAGARTGPGEVRFSIGDNYDAPRLGVVKLRWNTPTAGQNVQVAQAGCRYGVSTAAIAAPAAGGSFTFDVLQQSDPTECGGPLQDGCVWSAQADASWVTITTAMPRRGDDRVAFTVAPNGGAPRTATITVRDTHVVVSQGGQ